MAVFEFSGSPFAKAPNIAADGSVLPDTKAGRRLLAEMYRDRVRDERLRDAQLAIGNAGTKGAIDLATVRGNIETLLQDKRLSAEEQSLLKRLQAMAEEGSATRMHESGMQDSRLRSGEKISGDTIAHEARMKAQEQQAAARNALRAAREARIRQKDLLDAEAARELNRGIQIGSGGTLMPDGRLIAPGGMVEVLHQPPPGLGGLPQPPIALRSIVSPTVTPFVGKKFGHLLQTNLPASGITNTVTNTTSAPQQEAYPNPPIPLLSSPPPAQPTWLDDNNLKFKLRQHYYPGGF